MIPIGVVCCFAQHGISTCYVRSRACTPQRLVRILLYRCAVCFSGVSVAFLPKDCGFCSRRRSYL